MADRLKGKIAIVVGAGSIGPGWGNGKATAVTFAREGAKVMCVDVNPAAAEETVDIIRSEGGEARIFQAEVTRSAEVKAMVEACLQAYGRVDVLDNNVGVAAVGGVVEVSEEEWDRVMAINLKSCFLAMKHVIPGHGETGRRLDHQHLVRGGHPLHGRALCDLLRLEVRHEPPDPDHGRAVRAEADPRERCPAGSDGDADGREVRWARGGLRRRGGTLEGAGAAGAHGLRG